MNRIFGTHPWYAVLCMVLLGAVACTDQVMDTVVPPEVRTRATLAADSSTDVDRIDEVPFLPRFDVEVRAEGAFQPGKPIRIIAAVQANLTSPHTQVHIFAPEIAAAKINGWSSDFRVPVDTPLSALGSWTHRFSGRQRVQRTAELTVPAPGLYSVLVSVYDPSEVRAAESNGQPVQKQGYAEVWIQVTERGGTTVADFDPTLIPAEMLPQSGPFRRRENGAHPPARGSRTRAGAAYSTVPGTRTGDRYQALYRYVQGQYVWYRAQQEASVLIRYFDAAGSVVDMVAPTTDEQGYYTVPCLSNAWSASWVRYEAVLMLENDKVRMLGLGQLPAGSGTAFWCGTAPGVAQTRYEGAGLQPWVFENMRVAANRTLQVFGERRSKVEVQMGYSATDPSFYSISMDRITIQEAHALGEAGMYITAHEYGHAFHHKSLGGMSGGGCPLQHRVNGAYNLGCAYSEGFANYLAAATRTEVRPAYQSNQYYPAIYGSGNRYDGSIIEGAVAAFLLDLSDEYPDFSPQEPFDQVNVPAALVADAIRTCEVRTWQGWERANGVDHLIYCLEGVVDAGLYSQGYFPSRGFPPYEARMSTGHARPAVGALRTVWIKNLYDPARQPGTGGSMPGEPTDPGTGGETCMVDRHDMLICTDA